MINPFLTNCTSQLENDGYAILEDFLSEPEINQLKAECKNLIKNMPEANQRTIFSTVDSQAQQVKHKDALFLSKTVSILRTKTGTSWKVPIKSVIFTKREL